ncbi:hypothetical protein B0I35DRAFT_410148 [Stachybotrys elegans]|uniref:Rhodopsin domain-containing protein n=1 Tax=Stachybotrys elegans TaxID=80388 RepID=A0A8K0SRK7_9HYPO|nr:hypothetical protein B0I35DRAFT_410148 [Stachybotrys elegans]
MGITLIILLIVQVLCTLAARETLGKDIWTLTPEKITYGWKILYIAEFFFTAGAVSTKVTVLCLYLRIFMFNAFRRQCYMMLALSGLYLVAFTVSTGLLCRPIEYFWLGWNNAYDAVGTCINVNDYMMTTFIISAIIDVAIFLMPIPQVLKLHITPKRKVAICLIFGAGLFVTACSIIRTVFFIQHYTSYNPNNFKLALRQSVLSLVCSWSYLKYHTPSTRTIWTTNGSSLEH